jgi:hypothetical protein
MPLKFYEYSSGAVVCDDCRKEDVRRTLSGEYTGDERVYPSMFREIPTPAQCDNCLTQSEDYDDVMED